MISYKIRLTIDKNGVVNFGPGIEKLLDGVKVHGSILRASEGMGMAYSKAWKIIKEIEEANGFDILIRTRGRNSDTKITLEGEKLLSKYKEFKKEINEYSKKAFEEIFKEEN